MRLPRRPLGKTGLPVSVLGFGGAPIGFSRPREEDSFVALVRRALDLGITFFDTAPDYRSSEQHLGAALCRRRSEVILATKCGRVQVSTRRGWQQYEDWSEAGVLETIDASLRRLGTDYLDLVQLHSPPPWVLDGGAALRALLRAQRDGKVLHIGVTADGAGAWQALELDIFATLQVSYSILQQEPAADLLPAAAARGVGLIVKQPLANAIPTLRNRPAHPDWAAKWDLCQSMDWQIADAAGGRLALALRWVLANPLISTAIVGTTRVAHLDANVASATQPPLAEHIVQHYRAAYAYACRMVPQARSG